jgi:hypothetical protein
MLFALKNPGPIACYLSDLRRNICLPLNRTAPFTPQV